MKRLLFVGLLLLILNGAYLYAFDSPTLFYVANVLFHAGFGLITLFGFFFVLKTEWRILQSEARAASFLLLCAGLSGTALIYTGTAPGYLSLLRLHILLALSGTAFLMIHLLIRKYRWGLFAAATILALALPLLAKHMSTESETSIMNPSTPALSMEEEGAGPESPFFPSAADTNRNGIIPSDLFADSESCARSGCHPDIYDQWSTSAHRFASFNNQWYRKAVEYMQDVAGTQPSKWCAGCHDHALFFSGMMDRPVKELLDLPEAHMGLTCTSCHSIVSVRSTTGNGNFVIEYPAMHELATSKNSIVQAIHDFVLKLDSGPHKKTFMKPFMREQTGEYCSSCHKVHLDVPVNDYRWIRGFNEYDGWQSSGASGQGARSFYYPDQPKDCADCHMPLVRSDDAGNLAGVVHDHRFPGANTALPFVNEHQEQLDLVTDFLKNDQISIDIFALSEIVTEQGSEPGIPTSPQPERVASTFAEGDEMGLAVSGRGAGYTAARKILAPIDRVKPVVRPGDSVRLDVVVRTKGIGHFFPGGTVDAFDVWVELKAEDESGKILFWSGCVTDDPSGKKGPVDPGAHFYRSLLLDGHGNPINKRNAWATRAVVYVRLIPPSAADTVHFRFDVPEDVGKTIRLTAKVNYRKFSWWNTHFAYAGVRDPNQSSSSPTIAYDDGKWVFTGDTSAVSGKLKEVPDLPIITMAIAQSDLTVGEKGAPLPVQESSYDSRDLIRWNDCGIGLLLQGDLRASEQIFLKMTEIDSGFVDGWVNLGRARLLEGRTEEAQEALRKAEELDPDLARSNFFLGMTYKNQGEYDTALVYLRKAERHYPRDRVLLNQMGRILFLQRHFQEAVEILGRVVAIDPEDLQAHYNLMLCYRALGEAEKADHEQKLYLRFKADESSQAIVGPYLRNHAADNNERQAIHEHTTYPIDQLEGQTQEARQAWPPKATGK